MAGAMPAWGLRGCSSMAEQRFCDVGWGFESPPIACGGGWFKGYPRTRSLARIARRDRVQRERSLPSGSNPVSAIVALTQQAEHLGGILGGRWFESIRLHSSVCRK